MGDHISSRFPVPNRPPGFTVGESLLLIALSRACRPTSKGRWAAWAETIIVSQLFRTSDGREMALKARKRWAYWKRGS